MDYNKYLTGLICEQLEEVSPLVLASIVSQEGSAPRHTGTRMVVGADGQGYGTIGGGFMEADVIKEAKSVLASGRSIILEFDFTGADINNSGMICGGKSTVLLEYLGATSDNTDFFRRLYEALMRGDDCSLLTLYRGSGRAVDVGHCLLYDGGEVVENCPLGAADLEQLIAAVSCSASSMCFRDWQVLLEPIRKTKTLYCFGAGHVARPTAHIAALVGFRVVVVDDRADFANAERFPYAGTVRVIDDFNHALKNLDIDVDSFIVIFTREHLYDRVVLEQALKTNAGYIGMISSRRKRDAVFRALMDDGITEEELARVHSPIGLDIGAETPEEIAVSIVAELISERRKQQA